MTDLTEYMKISTAFHGRDNVWVGLSKIDARIEELDTDSPLIDQLNILFEWGFTEVSLRQVQTKWLPRPRHDQFNIQHLISECK